MASSRNRKTNNSGSNPGLTPIDDIHGAPTTREVEPDSTTGRLPAQDEGIGRKSKARRAPRKRSRTS